MSKTGLVKKLMMRTILLCSIIIHELYKQLFNPFFLLKEDIVGFSFYTAFIILL